MFFVFWFIYINGSSWVWEMFTRTLKHIEVAKSGHHLADDIFKCIFWNEISYISIKITLKFVPKVLIDNKQALFQI